MPKATVDISQVRKDLKTLEGAYVVLRRMSFGQKQERQDLALKMTLEGDKRGTRGVVEGTSMPVTLFDFSKCVVEHNLYLDDEETKAMNLGSARDLAQLDPRVGEEIASYIDELNNFTQQHLDDLGNGSSSES